MTQPHDLDGALERVTEVTLPHLEKRRAGSAAARLDAKAIRAILSHLQQVEAENKRLREALDALAEAERLDDEYQDLCGQADAEGWDEQTGGSHLASAWKPVDEAYKRARELRSLALTTSQAGASEQ